MPAAATTGTPKQRAAWRKAARTRAENKRKARLAEFPETPPDYRPPLEETRSPAEPDVTGGARTADPARLAECAPELAAIASRLEMFDAQMRRGAIPGIPRPFLLRARALVRYVFEGEPLDTWLAPIEPASM
jgi:hypothetical protein